MRVQLCRKASSDAAEVLAQPQIANRRRGGKTELPPRALHVDVVLVVRVEEEDGHVAIGEWFAPHLSACFVVERHAVTGGGKGILIDGDDFSVGQDFFAVAKEVSHVTGDYQWRRPQRPKRKLRSRIAGAQKSKAANRCHIAF